MSDPAIPFTAFGDILARYARVFAAAWRERKHLTSQNRTPLERQFLPANLEIIDTPAPALPRAVIATITTAFVLVIVWAVWRPLRGRQVKPQPALCECGYEVVCAAPSKSGLRSRVRSKVDPHFRTAV